VINFHHRAHSHKYRMTQLTVLPLPTDEPRADVLLFPEAHASRVNASGNQSDHGEGRFANCTSTTSEQTSSPPRRHSGVLTRGPNEPPSSSRFRPLHAVGSSTPPTDQRLVDLVRDQHRAVWRALRRLGVPVALLDDATQEVFIVASRKLDFIDRDSLRPFLYGTALRVAANFRRSRQARQLDSLQESDTNPWQPTHDAEQLVYQKQLRELLDQILDEMSDELREIFVLFELEKLTRIEISELLGLPAGTIASRLRRAREQFEDACERLRALPQGGPR
jgi:RNA polymerase sigma-70 factor, ECF subfamily